MAALQKTQAEIDEEAEEILKFVAHQRSLPPSKILEGRIGSADVLGAEELLRESLIDEICSVDEAKVELIIKIWFGDKQTITEGEENESTKSII